MEETKKMARKGEGNRDRESKGQIKEASRERGEERERTGRKNRKERDDRGEGRKTQESKED